MGTKMAVHAFSVIFMAHFDKQLLHASPYNHFSVRDLAIFAVQTLPETEINNFSGFTNSFRTKINFTLELSSKRIVFLDIEVFKGPRFIQTQFSDLLSRQKRFKIRISPHFTLSALGRALHMEKL